MKYIFTCMGMFFFFCGIAQKEKTAAYIEQYKEIAIQEMIRSGVPAAITLAQGVLESQSGESVLVKKSNNHFGIKCKVEWTGAKTYHDDDARGECFRVYTTAEESYKDHSDFLRTRAHYAFLFSLDPTNYEAWAYGLKKAGYATAPTYPQKLIKVINDYQLNQFNYIALARLKESTDQINNKIIPVKIDTLETTAIATTEEKIAIEQKEEIVDATAISSTNITQPINGITINYPIGIFTINQTKVIYTKAGTSLLSLANQYDITLSKLLAFNEMGDIDILNTDQLIFLERKQKKGLTEYHVVKTGESLIQIAQSTGVRLENILQYNNLGKDIVPTVGTKIYLRVPLTVASTSNKK